MKKLGTTIPLSIQERKLLVDLYSKRQMDPVSIAYKFNVSEALIWRRLRAHCINKTWSSRRYKPTNPSLEHCYACGQSLGNQLKIRKKESSKPSR